MSYKPGGWAGGHGFPDGMEGFVRRTRVAVGATTTTLWGSSTAARIPLLIVFDREGDFKDVFSSFFCPFVVRPLGGVT